MTMMMMGLQPKTVSDAPVEDSDADGESEDGEDDGPLSRPRPRTVPRQL